MFDVFYPIPTHSRHTLMALLSTVAVSPRSTPTHTMAAPANSKPTCAIVFFDCGNLLTPFIAALLYHRRCKIFVKNRKLTEILSACAIMNTNGSLSVSKKSFRHAWSRNTPSAQPVSVRFAPGNRGATVKNLFFPLPLFSELVKVLKIFDFVRDTPLGFPAPLSFRRGNLHWRHFACFPFLGFPRTPFTRKGYAASVKRHSR